MTSKVTGSSAETLPEVIDRLAEARLDQLRTVCDDFPEHPLPSRTVILELIEALRSVLFPGYFGSSEVTRSTLKYYIGATLDHVRRTLEVQVLRGIAFADQQKNPESTQLLLKSQKLTETFIKQLPSVRDTLLTDVQAAFEGDPAATSQDEAAFSYPGIMALTNFRLAHELYQLHIPLIPRIITEQAHSLTGIDIHPGAHIGSRFFIDHGTGVVIGETCRIGDNVHLYQGVTLGAKSFPLDEQGNPIKGIDRHPIVEDDVIIYSGATVLGRVTIGRGSVIGGNVWLTRSVPAGSQITQAGFQRNCFNGGGGI